MSERDRQPTALELVLTIPLFLFVLISYVFGAADIARQLGLDGWHAYDPTQAEMLWPALVVAGPPLLLVYVGSLRK